MATVEEVRSDLERLYPGQLVLYAIDLAKVLGKTDKALAHLIADKQLPFELKKLGGKVCVDVYQVARWLATTDEDSSQISRTAGKDRAAGTGSSRPRGRPSSIAARIMALRVGAGTHISAIAQSLSDPADREFLRCVAGRLIDDAAEEAPIRATVVETDDSFSPLASCKLFFEYRDALAFVESAMKDRPGKYNGRIVVRLGRSVIYEAFCVDGAPWVVLDDFLTSRAL
ncbi:hypothetical protein [Thauera propionica]|uniref:hypothetical protein n=1 Tax=Thauera propionica TaxID=2019431 RepID=UPI0023F2819B|nr:hypothetical protein [Thauera propionica]MDD3676083.1 hypothetical protein [Thauera propionica]